MCNEFFLMERERLAGGVGESGEGEVFGGAAGFFSPLLEDAAIAEGELILLGYAQLLGDAVDPLGSAFELGEDAQWGFIDDAVALVVGPLGAPFFVAEDGNEADGGEDLRQSIAIGKLGFGFDAMLVAVFADARVGNALVGEQPAAGVVADADEFALDAELAVGCVVKGVALKAARGDETKADGGEAGFERRCVRDAELDLGFDSAHTSEYTAEGVGFAALGVDNEKMQTLRLRVDLNRLDSLESQEAIEQAAAILRGGGTVALPTETVYGLGANALDPAAVASIFAAKERPGWDPLIAHVCDAAMLAVVAAEVPEAARRLMEAFWPGPLTLLLPRSVRIPDAVTAGRALVGVRMPAHPVALAVIRRAGVPIAAPSANRFGHTSPTTVQHVLEDLDGRIDAVVDAGPTDCGVESTVLDPTTSPMTVYRPGAITLEQIREIAGPAEMFQESEQLGNAPRAAMPSPGVGLRHYAPRARLILVDAGESLADLAENLRQLARHHAGERVGVMLPEELSGDGKLAVVEVYAWGRWSEPEELAHRLFAGLRALDAAGCDVILCPQPQAVGIGVAIRDRLRKAATPVSS